MANSVHKERLLAELVHPSTTPSRVEKIKELLEILEQFETSE